MIHKHRRMSNYSFKIFKFVLAIRDLINPPQKLLSGIEMIRAGAHILDFGCGPGSYTIAAARMIQPSGIVYAVDSNPSAINEVVRRARKEGLVNVHTVLTDSNTGLSDYSVDVILLIYVFHEFKNPHLIVSELDRILKPTGVLVVKENKLNNDKVISVISHDSRNLKPIKLAKQGKLKNKKTILFFSKGYN
jgi:ubiquinone/menaquinone biosynthesis C-methylase UbiE